MKKYTISFWLLIAACAIAGDSIVSIAIAGALIAASGVCLLSAGKRS